MQLTCGPALILLTRPFLRWDRHTCVWCIPVHVSPTDMAICCLQSLPDCLVCDYVMQSHYHFLPNGNTTLRPNNTLLTDKRPNFFSSFTFWNFFFKTAIWTMWAFPKRCLIQNSYKVAIIKGNTVVISSVGIVWFIWSLVMAHREHHTTANPICTQLIITHLITPSFIMKVNNLYEWMLSKH